MYASPSPNLFTDFRRSPEASPTVALSHVHDHRPCKARAPLPALLPVLLPLSSPFSQALSFALHPRPRPRPPPTHKPFSNGRSRSCPRSFLSSQHGAENARQRTTPSRSSLLGGPTCGCLICCAYMQSIVHCRPPHWPVRITYTATRSPSPRLSLPFPAVGTLLILCTPIFWCLLVPLYRSSCAQHVSLLVNRTSGRCFISG